MGDQDTSGLGEVGDRCVAGACEERRQAARKTYFVPVNYATPDRAYSEFIRNVSESGVFIETKHLIPPGRELTLTFSLPGYCEPLKLMGKVVRTDTMGMGVMFTHPDESLKDVLRTCIEEI